MDTIKTVCVGDGAVGKTCLLVSFSSDKFMGEHTPTIFDNYSKNVCIDDQITNIGLWDTAGQEDYDRLRPLSYPGTDCYVVCYSSTSHASFANVKTKWIPEVRNFISPTETIPIVLVATKTDLRSNDENDRYGCVTTEQGQALADELGCHSFHECSAKTGEGVQDVFASAVRHVRKISSEKVTTGGRRTRWRKMCTIS